MSVALWNACAVNCRVWVLEVHPATGSTVIAVTSGCTATGTGLLVTPPPATVMLAVPLIGTLPAPRPLQLIKVESQTPPQTSPVGETVTTAVLEDVKVNEETETGLPAEFVAVTESWVTAPELTETEVGATVTVVTVLLAELPPPQPARNAMKNRKKPGMANRRMHPPRQAEPAESMK